MGSASPGCRVGQFRCGDGRCVDASLICDGNYDCIDAADERDCSKYIYSKTWKIKVVESLIENSLVQTWQ